MQNRKNSELFEYINQSGMTKAQIISRLNEMIDAESLKPEEQRDAEFISACLELQYFVTTGEEYQSSKEVAKKKLMQAIHVQKADINKANARKLSIGVAAACVACLFLVLPILGQTLLERSWIEGTTVNGGEVYRLNGKEVDPKLLSTVIADNSMSEFSIQTSDFDMISCLDGVQNFHLEYVPEGWYAYEYSFEIIEDTIFYKERYQNSEKKKEIVYKCSLFPNQYSVQGGIEQDSAGEYLQINGNNIYFTKNIDVLVATWSEGFASYSLYGPISLDDMFCIISSIGGE